MWEEREAFRRHSRRHRLGRPVTYPPELSDIPPFADWLKERVQHVERAGEQLDADIIQYSCPPERYTASHRTLLECTCVFGVLKAALLLGTHVW